MVAQSTGGSQAEREAAQQLGQSVRDLARAQGQAARAQAQVKAAEQALARAQTEGAREAAQARLDAARETLQEAQDGVREAQENVREAQQDVEQAAREQAQQAREQAQQAREIAQQVREQAQRIRVEQVQVPMPPMPPMPPDPGTTIHLPGGGGPFDSHPQIPEGAVVISIGFFVMTAFIAVGWPIARAFGRRMDRKSVAATAATAQLPGELNARLERIEHSVESIAIEVERISEGQRYAAKLLSDIRPVQALGPGQKVPEYTERK